MKLMKKCIQLYINSKYYNINEINQIKHDNDSSLSIIHTNIASITKYFDDLEQVLSTIKTKFDMFHGLPATALTRALTAIPN